MQNELKEILEKLSEKETKEFLLDVLLYNEDIYDEFRRTHLSLFPSIPKEQYKGKMANEIRRCFNRHGYIGEEESFDFCHVLDNYIKESNLLIESKNYELAFFILALVLNTVPEYEPDDSYGCVNNTMCDCIEAIENLFDKAYQDDDKEILDKMLQFVLDEISSRSLSNYCIEIYPVIDKFIEKDCNLKELENALFEEVEKNEKGWTRKKYIEILKSIWKKTGETDKINLINN